MKGTGASAPFFMELIKKICKGDTHAEAFLHAIWLISQVWDDLIDRDKKVEPARINEAMWLALVGLPRNPFYVSNFQNLNSILATSILNWEYANQLEAEGTDKALSIAFVLRSSYVDLLIMTALIIGGKSWADELVPAIRDSAHCEGFDGYLANLEVQKKAGGEK